MVNKEKLEQLTSYIAKLTKLTEGIYEREIYPVSFFSQAYDVTNKIQESLHQIEIAQIELFESQMKKHQAQIQSIKHLKVKPEPPIQSEVLTELPEPAYTYTTQASFEKQANPIHQDETEEKSENSELIITLPTSIDEKLLSTIETIDNKNESKILSDLQKVFTLNDRFRFCRELFSSNEYLLNQTFSELNKLESFDSSFNYVKEHFNWNLEDEVVAEFIAMVEKRFE